MRVLYVDHGFSRCADTKLEVAGWVHDTPRHFAGCRDDGKLVVAAPQLADLPIDNVVAVFSHELGHAVDFLYPTRFQLVIEELREFPGDWDVDIQRRPTADLDAKTLRAVMDQWKNRDEEQIEQLADAIAELVVKKPVTYAGPCLLQTFAGGEPRPVGLR